MPDYAYELHVQAGQRMPGVFLVNDRASMGHVIDDLHVLAVSSRDDEWESRVVRIPLK